MLVPRSLGQPIHHTVTQPLHFTTQFNKARTLHSTRIQLPQESFTFQTNYTDPSKTDGQRHSAFYVRPDRKPQVLRYVTFYPSLQHMFQAQQQHVATHGITSTVSCAYGSYHKLSPYCSFTCPLRTHHPTKPLNEAQLTSTVTDPFAEADEDTGESKQSQNYIHIRIQRKHRISSSYRTVGS